MEEIRKNFRFAIMGAGNIANKFCDAVKLLENCEVAAIASKSMERARAFADKNGIKSAYDSYEKMLVEEKPDCVYIAVTSNAHYELSMLCLKYSVPVLCEKAMFLNAEQAKEVFALARRKNVFVMEAMWSRFLPAVKKAKEWVESGRIGEPVYGRIAIGFHAAEDPENRYFSPNLGGGAAYDLTVYCYEIMTWLIDWDVEVVNAAAVIGETGVDVTDHVVLRFTKSLKGEKSHEATVTPCPYEMLASCESTFLADLGEELTLYGRDGKLVIPKPHFASEAFLYNKEGQCAEHYRDEITKNGFVYEAAEAADCIRNGRIESQTVPHSLTLACAELFDRLMENSGGEDHLS